VGQHQLSRQHWRACELRASITLSPTEVAQDRVNSGEDGGAVNVGEGSGAAVVILEMQVEAQGH